MVLCQHLLIQGCSSNAFKQVKISANPVKRFCHALASPTMSEQFHGNGVMLIHSDT